MSIGNQMLVISLCLLISFFFIRAFYHGMKRYQLNKSAYRKRKKTENFIQQLLYTKYKEEISFGWRLFYYLICLIHLFLMVVCVVIYIINRDVSFRVGRIIAVVLYYSDMVWVVSIALLFNSRDGGDLRYSRWIRKKRGKQPKKK